MRVYGTPNTIVNVMVKVGANKKFKPMFKFNDKGYFDVDTTKLSTSIVKRLKTHFKCTDEQVKAKEVKKEVKAPKKEESLDKINFMTLKKMAKQKGMEVESNTKKKDILKYLKEVK